MTKIRMPQPPPPPSARAVRPWLFNLGVAVAVLYVAWLFYRSPELSSAILHALGRSVGY